MWGSARGRSPTRSTMALPRPTLLKLLAPLLAFALTFAVLTLVNRGESPPAPPGADLAVPAGSTSELIAGLQDAVRAAPDDADGYAALGQAYLQRARETGDPSWNTRAERSFDAASRRDPRNLDAVVGAGTLALARHDFRRGLELGERAHRLAPQSARPYPVLADALVELGRYEQAASTIQRFVDIKPTLASYARASYFRELSGDLDGAAAAMRLAVSAGAGAPENLAYVQALLGDLELQRGRMAAAGDAYRSALRSVPGHAPAEVGLARLATARGDLDGAIARLRRAGERLPLPGTIALLAETELAAGRTAAARADLAVVRAQHRLFRATGTRPDVELVLFEASHGDPAHAVRLGRGLYAAAPSVRSADALGWALTRSGRPAEGLAFARRALRTGSRDPLFQLHAGLASGDPALAARHLRGALRGAASLSPLDAQRARKALGR
jgi:tetratricopeptide (TPR) repeat protein